MSGLSVHTPRTHTAQCLNCIEVHALYSGPAVVRALRALVPGHIWRSGLSLFLVRFNWTCWL